MTTKTTNAAVPDVVRTSIDRAKTGGWILVEIDPEFRPTSGSLDEINGPPLYGLTFDDKPIANFFMSEAEAKYSIELKSRIDRNFSVEHIGVKYLSPIFLLHYIHAVNGTKNGNFFQGHVESVRASNFEDDTSIIEVVGRFVKSNTSCTHFFKVADPTFLPEVGEQCWGDQDMFVVDWETQMIYSREGENITEVKL